MNFIDTHCHLNDPRFTSDWEETWIRSQAAGVSQAICIGADIIGSRAAAQLSMREGIYAAIGIHPESGAEWNETSKSILRELYRQYPRIVAYGEIGLDYHWNTLPKDRQQSIFAEQIEFAAELNPKLPLIIHCRDAQDDLRDILKESKRSAPVVMHCFTGDIAAAEQNIDAGYYLGIGGVITFKKSELLRNAIAAAPLDRLLLETDAPYLAPQQWRGKRNEPSYIPSIAETLANVKGISSEEVALVTTQTARSLFQLDRYTDAERGLSDL
jgi:TatD DNase family protein